MSLIDQTIIKAYDPKHSDQAAASLVIKIELLLPPKDRVEVDDIELSHFFKNQYDRFYISRDQVFVVNFKHNPYIITIDRIVGSHEGFVYLSKESVI